MFSQLRATCQAHPILRTMFPYKGQWSEHNVTTRVTKLVLKFRRNVLAGFLAEKGLSIYRYSLTQSRRAWICWESPRAALGVVGKVIIAPVGSRILDVQQILEVWLFTPLTL